MASWAMRASSASYRNDGAEEELSDQLYYSRVQFGRGYTREGDSDAARRSGFRWLTLWDQRVS